MDRQATEVTAKVKVDCIVAGLMMKEIEGDCADFGAEGKKKQGTGIHVDTAIKYCA